MIGMKTVSLVRCFVVAVILVGADISIGQIATGPAVTTRPSDRGASRRVLSFRATLASPGGELPFGLEIEPSSDGTATARLINGSEIIDLPDARFSEDRLRIDIRHYDAVIEAHAAEIGGQRNAMRRKFVGTWKKRADKNAWSELPFEAVENVPYRFPPGPRVEGELARSQSIEGRWRVTFGKSEDPAIGVFRTVPDGGVEGTFLTTTGDYRFLAGDYESGRLRLSSFDGAHAFLFDARLDEADRLRGDFWSRDAWHETWVAVRAPDAKLPDGFELSGVRRGVSLSSLRFRGLDGETHSLGDEAFRGKARIIEVFGTWCPNCHDAAKLLNDLHQSYANQGLSIVGVAFEATGQFERDARQVRRFIDRHDLKYPVLLGGRRPREDSGKAFPLLERIRAYPTTLLVDEDGNVVCVHYGFSGPATGEAYLELRAEFEKRIRELLDAEPDSI